MGVLVGIAVISPVYPHESWISDGGLRNSAGEFCCGEGDCFIVPKRMVHEGRGGFIITFTQVVDGKEDTYTELVPYKEIQPSPDLEWWRCKRPDGSRRCFFGPMGGT